MRIYQISKTATAGPGADSVLVDRHVTCLASRVQSQRPALLQTAAETTTGKEELKAVRRVRHCKEVGLPEWPLAGRATVLRILTVSVSACLFVGGRFFQNVYRRPLALPSPFTLHHSHFSYGRQNRRSSFRSGRSDNLVTIARFGKPLFANMHDHIHAVAGALRKPTVACPHRAPLDGQ